jgi:hypothetical protein
MAPEQVAGEPAGPATDVYSLGLVVVECLTGRQCYPGSQVESVIARLHRRPSIPQELPGWLRDVLGAMTATEPIRRPEAAAVADALRRRDAEPAVASTAPIALHAPTGVVPAGAVGPTVTAWDVAQADATAEFPAGTMPRTGGLRLTSRRGARTLVGGALVFLVVGLLLAWMVSGADRQASGRHDGPATTSSTSTVPTTVAPILPTPAEAPPAVGQGNGGGSGDGRSNGNGQGNGKGKKGG